LYKHGRDIAVLKLDGVFASIDFVPQEAIVPSFVVGYASHLVVKTRRIDCRVKPGNDELGHIGYFAETAPNTSPAALTPLSWAPCAVEKKFGEVASPAKNSRPSTGAASAARLPEWPGKACE